MNIEQIVEKFVYPKVKAIEHNEPALSFKSIVELIRSAEFRQACSELGNTSVSNTDVDEKIAIPPKDLDISDIFYRHSYDITVDGVTVTRMTIRQFTDAVFEINKALSQKQGCADEDMMIAYSRGQGDVVEASLSDDYTRPLVDATEWLTNYKQSKGVV